MARNVMRVHRRDRIPRLSTAGDTATIATAAQAMATLLDLAESQGWQAQINICYCYGEEQFHLELTGKLHRTDAANQWLVKFAGGQMVLVLSGVICVTVAEDASAAAPADVPPVVRIFGVI